jgi:hypothetical protein
MSSATVNTPSKSLPLGADSTNHSNNPFETIFDDDEETGDEWWDDEDTIKSGGSSTSKNLHTIGSPESTPPVGLGLTTKTSLRTSTRRKYSVHKPIREKSKGRQRKQNAKAGIKVVTSFSRHQPAHVPVQLEPSRQVGCFVDLAALQALSGEQAQATGRLWKSKKTKHTKADVSDVLLENTSKTLACTQRSTENTNHIPPPLKPNGDLSPNDRPIVIGISIPSASLAEHTTSPQVSLSATTNAARGFDHRTPDTPTIIITPAQESSTWSPLDSYTQGTEALKGFDACSNNYTPPIPTMPASFLEEERQRLAAQRSYFSPDSDDATNWGDEVRSATTARSRTLSSCTMFEEDESPIIARKDAFTSNTDRHASISTVATQRRSRGWWNYITTPFLTRSNTLASRNVENEHAPALPSIAIAAAKAQEAEREDRVWDKQFSPLTPKTSTTMTSDSWWDVDTKLRDSQVESPVVQDTRHKVQTSTGTLPILFSGTRASSITSQHATPLSTPVRASSTLSPGYVEIVSADVLPRTRSLQSNNPFMQPQLSHLASSTPVNESSRGIVAQLARQTPPAVVSMPTQSAISLSPSPPPPYSPSPPRVRYKAILPPRQSSNSQQATEQPNLEPPLSPGPLSPGLQQAMSSRGDIPLSTVPLTPPRSRPINLNSGYPSEPPVRQNGGQFMTGGFHPPPKKAKAAEKKRQRYEKEDAIARKAGGWWRGRGCISQGGCYGRTGAEGRKRRRWYLGLILLFLAVIILAVILATTLHRKSNTTEQPTQWLNLTGFPPIFLGLSTVIAPANVVSNTGCVFPATQWSCVLPKELQSTVAPSQPNQPNFFLYIQWDNSSSTNATFANVTGNLNLSAKRAGNPVSAGQFIKHLLMKPRDIVTFISDPAPPSYAEQTFLGNTTDGILSSSKAGEPTPFYISLLSSVNSTLVKRDVKFGESALYSRDTANNNSLSETDQFPNITSIIPAPTVNSDGTAAPGNLLPSPLPNQQPIRLYDRGLPSEHYGFYTYFDRSIFLKSLALLNNSNISDGEVPDDQNGGAKESEASFRCTWTQTRFMVQIWTRKNTTAQLLNSTTTIATSFTQPGTFPYPITVTTDRHGGDPSKKMIYCYALNSREQPIAGSGKINGETRGFGGVVVNPAPTFFSNSSDPSLGGFDGGTGGCGCQWKNFQTLVHA